MSVSTSHVVVGIFLIVYSSIDPINTTLPFSLIICCNNFLIHPDSDHLRNNLRQFHGRMLINMLTSVIEGVGKVMLMGILARRMVL